LIRNRADRPLDPAHGENRRVIVRRIRSEDLAPRDTAAVRSLLERAFGRDDFGEDDWRHALGGMHFVLAVDGAFAAHAAVVERELHAGDLRLRCGYVEAVATDPGFQGRGLGSRVMEEAGEYIRERFELGALGTGSFRFYERLGWQRWRGPTFVRTADGPLRTPEEDGYVMVLVTPSSPPLDLSAPLSCDWRPGDVW
jgi:aminoglycoside 2'-N-acetyltransferase I